MHEIFRIAPKEDFNMGLYRNNSLPYEVKDMLCDQSRHPIPSDDAQLREFYFDTGFEMLYGFANQSQARSWIYKHEIRQALADYDFVVYRFRMTGKDGVHHKAGDTQAMFDPAHAELIETIEILDFFKGAFYDTANCGPNEHRERAGVSGDSESGDRAQECAEVCNGDGRAVYSGSRRCSQWDYDGYAHGYPSRASDGTNIVLFSGVLDSIRAKPEILH